MMNDSNNTNLIVNTSVLLVFTNILLSIPNNIVDYYSNTSIFIGYVVVLLIIDFINSKGCFINYNILIKDFITITIILSISVSLLNDNTIIDCVGVLSKEGLFILVFIIIPGFIHSVTNIIHIMISNSTCYIFTGVITCIIFITLVVISIMMYCVSNFGIIIGGYYGYSIPVFLQSMFIIIVLMTSVMFNMLVFEDKER